MATRDLDRLAKRVKAHRMEQYSSRDAAAAAAGVTRNTWKRVEEGQEVRESTYAKVDRALGWASGSCLLIAEGGEPVLVDEVLDLSVRSPRLTEDAVRRAAFEAAMAKMPNAPIGEVQGFVDELVKVLHKTGRLEEGP